MVEIFLKEVFPTIYELDPKAQMFFKVLDAIINNIPTPILAKVEIDFPVFMEELAKRIIQRPITEDQPSKFDFILSGIMGLLRNLLTKFPESKYKIGQNMGLVKELLQKCLFQFPTSKLTF